MAEPTIVDADGHVVEPEAMWQQYIEDKRYHWGAPRAVVDREGRRRVFIEGQLCPPQEAPPKLAPAEQNLTSRAGGYDSHARIEDLDDEGIDLAVLFPSTAMRVIGVKDPGLANALCAAYNNWLFDYCKPHPERLVGAALLPMQDVEMAVAEAKRCVSELGFKAVTARPNPIYGGRTLANAVYEPLWQVVEEMGVPFCIHESTSLNITTAGADRFDDYCWKHAVDHPHEQQMALVSLLEGGVLEDHPDLRVAFLESGAGWVAHWLDRLDEHVECYGASGAEHLTMKPSEYFQRQCFISADPLERTLPAMVELVGDHCIVWATDYPHPDGMFPGAARAIAGRTDLPEMAKTKILGENALRLYGIQNAKLTN